MIEFIPETGSTNADLAARLRAGEMVPEGDWLVTDRQSAGRGRQGREWLDGAGNFMGSTAVRLGFGDPPPASLALIAGLALHGVVAPLLVLPHTAMLKWPNDLMIGNAKLAGVLLEREGDSVVVGIGVNLASAPRISCRETIALGDICDAPTRNAFAAALTAQFAVELARWRAYGLPTVIARWQAAGHPSGTKLSIRLTIGLSIGEPGEPVLDGTFAGLTDDGQLQLRLGDGSLRIVNAGEVRFRQE